MRNKTMGAPPSANGHALGGSTVLTLRGYAPLVVLALSLSLLLAAVPAKERSVNAIGSGGSTNEPTKNVGAAPPGATFCATSSSRRFWAASLGGR